MDKEKDMIQMIGKTNDSVLYGVKLNDKIEIEAIGDFEWVCEWCVIKEDKLEMSS